MPCCLMAHLRGPMHGYPRGTARGGSCAELPGATISGRSGNGPSKPRRGDLLKPARYSPSLRPPSEPARSSNSLIRRGAFVLARSPLVSFAPTTAQARMSPVCSRRRYRRETSQAPHPWVLARIEPTFSAAEVRRSDCLPPRRARSGERPGRRLSPPAEALPVGGSARQRTAAGAVVSYRKTRGVPAS